MQIEVDGHDVVYRPLVGHGRRVVLDYLKWLRKRDDQDLDYVRQVIAKQCRTSVEDLITEQNIFSLLSTVLWLDDQQAERESLRNLTQAVLLQLRAPHVAHRSCDSCSKWLYDHARGTVCYDRKNQPIPRTDVVPCDTEIGCPKGHYSNPIELTDQNATFLSFWRDKYPTGSLPDDSVVARNSRALIRVYEAGRTA